MGAHRNVDQRRKFSFYSNNWLPKTVFTQIYSEHRINGGTQERWSEVKFKFFESIFFMEDHLLKILLWKSYQWRYTGTRIKSKNLNILKLIFIGRSFSQKFILDIVSLGVHRNDDQTRQLELFEKIWLGRFVYT